jgi:hypothetical protein
VTDWEKAFGEMEAAWRYADRRAVAAEARVAALEEATERLEMDNAKLRGVIADFDAGVPIAEEET